MNNLEQQIINQDVTTKLQKVEKVTDDFNKYLEESRVVYRESFFQISIVSAGVLSLSVTYVGYITSIASKPISYKWLLFVGWIGLTLAVLGGLLRNLLYANMGHWQMQSDRIKALRDRDKSILELSKKAPHLIVDIKTEKEMDEYIDTLNSNLKTYNRSNKYTKGKEKISKLLWLIAEKAAIIGLGFGILCIVVFAAINLPG